MAQFSGPRIGWPSALYALVGLWLTRYVVQADGHISMQARKELPSETTHLVHCLQQGRLALPYSRPAAISLHALEVSGVVHRTIALHGEEDLVGHFPHQILPVPGRPNGGDGANRQNPVPP